MKLIDMNEDKVGIITSIKNDPKFLNRINAIGITEGVSLQVVKNHKKLPILVYVRETLLALNRKDAEDIEVKEVA